MKRGFFGLLILIVCLSGCKKNEELGTISFKELYPIQVGKVFYYRLDSTVVNSTKDDLIKISHNAKDSIDAEFIDAEGRRAFRIYRYLRDTLTPISNKSNWKYLTTYQATVTDNTIEYIDNNLRFVSLVGPVSEGKQWKGTQYINTISGTKFAFYDNWNFEYQNIDRSFTVKKGTIHNTYQVLQTDDQNPDRPVGKDILQSRDFSKEVYAKGIGLIYKNILHWVYQPETVPPASTVYRPAAYEDDSFGLTLSLIDYK